MAHHLQRRLVTGFVLLALLAVSAVSIAASGTFEMNVAVDDRAVVEVSNQRGTVIVRGADTDEVMIRAHIAVDERLARTNPQKAAKLIRAIRRSPPVESTGNQIVIGELTRKTHQRYVSISYDIRVPSTATVKVHSISGDIRVSGVSGTVDATSDTGEVTLAERADSGRVQTRS